MSNVDAGCGVDAMQCSFDLCSLASRRLRACSVYVYRGPMPVLPCLAFAFANVDPFQRIHSTPMRPVSLGAGPPSPPSLPHHHPHPPPAVAAPSRRASTTLSGTKQQQRSSRAKKAAKGKENVEPPTNGMSNASVDMDIVKESSSGASMVQLAMLSQLDGGEAGDTRRTASGGSHARQQQQQPPLSLPAAGDGTSVAQSRRQQRRRQMRKPLLHSEFDNTRRPTRLDGSLLTSPWNALLLRTRAPLPPDSRGGTEATEQRNCRRGAIRPHTERGDGLHRQILRFDISWLERRRMGGRVRLPSQIRLADPCRRVWCVRAGWLAGMPYLLRAAYEAATSHAMC